MNKMLTASSDSWSGTNNLDAIRFLLASLVIFSHSFPISVRGGNAYEPLARVTGNELTIGTMAVDAFFAISGFLITKSWLKSHGIFDFLKKRVARIYPGFIAVVLIQQFLITPLINVGSESAFSLNQIVLTLFRCVNLASYPYKGLQPITIPDNPVPGDLNGSLWTIRYEFCCYLLVLFLGLLMLYRRPVRLLVCFIAFDIWFVSNAIPPWNRALTGLVGYVMPWPRFLSFFVAGMIFFLLRRSIPTTPKLAGVAAAIVVLSVFWPPTLRFTLPTAGTYCLFWLAFTPRIDARSFGKYGDFSYGIYLYGFPIQQLLVYGVPAVATPYRLFVTAWPLAILAGVLSWHGVEKHFLRRARGPATAISTPPSLIGS